MINHRPITITETVPEPFFNVRLQPASPLQNPHNQIATHVQMSVRTPG